eukprot:CAMPEP_0203882110 /NCGR_PEP_ID=MMETSP0359-20131031/26345_1 /ASSEMBLY_ACC=CAM_ASM_000338 /TAXON_ID=268821 /ORGANISM="Scrippsiella Hangoei, Strain SHTV-5" /LENGTH=300 /DNA_ID=CAMNT_0050802105 /DNA_START=79 /DNA_END=978 /DNA_ORIENTATION=+
MEERRALGEADDQDPMHPAMRSLHTVGSGLGQAPPGWPGFLAGAPPSAGELSRGGLFDDQRLIHGVADALATAAGPGLAGPHSDFFRGGLLGSTQSDIFEQPSVQGCMPRSAASGIHRADGHLNIKRPETPLLAYVNRAAFPGFVDPDEYEGHLQQSARELEHQQASTWQGAAVVREALSATSNGPASRLDEWEAELALWKQRYGCSADDADADADAGGAGDAAGPAPGSAPAADRGASMDVTQAREPEVHRSTPEAELALWKQRYGCSADDADADAGGAGDAAGPAPGSAPAADHLGKK